MFTWALGCGIFSYYIFLLGLLGKLQYPYIVLGTAIFILLTYYQLQRNFSLLQWYQQFATFSVFEKICVGLLALQIFINLIGALGPEIAYDAVWYHLTIPRIWLLEEKIFFIPYGPFSYSLLPKLLDMFYVAALAISNEIVAKAIHWFFGILSGIVTYRIARHFTNRKYALLATIIFFSNLVVGWQSITAYIDLGRTFFEGLALLALLQATKNDSNKWRYVCAAMLGLAILSKLIALMSLVAVFLIFIYQQKYRTAVSSILIALSIPVAWLALNFMQTGNPIYPVFSAYDLNSNASIWDGVRIWFTSDDPLSPLYVILVPLLGALYIQPLKNSFIAQNDERKALYRILLLYCSLVFALWLITPRTGGGRFILPYLPAFSVLIVYPLSLTKVKNIQTIGIGTIIIVSIFSALYRAAANIRYIPVLLGTQTKEAFLQSNLPQKFGDNWYYLTTESLKKLYTQPQKPDDLEWIYTNSNDQSNNRYLPQKKHDTIRNKEDYQGRKRQYYQRED